MNVNALAAGIQQPRPIQTGGQAASPVSASGHGADRLTLSHASESGPASSNDAIRLPNRPTDGEPTDPDRHGPSLGGHEGQNTISFYA
ncbi:MAG: hypothetical protein DHS20C21_20360 [Gemmatimonadota bacterium]|nr:MAG: hypothetical protein DHS20C21_20360 [Gemmatimonadota bacterium]